MIGDVEFGGFAEQFIGNNVLHRESGQEFSAGAQGSRDVSKCFFTVFYMLEGANADDVVEGFVFEGDFEDTAPGNMGGDIFQAAEALDTVILKKSVDAGDEIRAFGKFWEEDSGAATDIEDSSKMPVFDERKDGFESFHKEPSEARDVVKIDRVFQDGNVMFRG